MESPQSCIHSEILDVKRDTLSTTKSHEPALGWLESPKFVDGYYVQDDVAVILGNRKHGISGTWKDLFRAIRTSFSRTKRPVMQYSSYHEKDYCVNSIIDHDITLPCNMNSIDIIPFFTEENYTLKDDEEDTLCPDVSLNSWKVDFKEPSHIATSTSDFIELHQFSEAERHDQYTATATGETFPIFGIGTAILTLASRRKVVLFNVLYVPGALSGNVVSASMLHQRGFTVAEEGIGLGIWSNSHKVATAVLTEDGDYELDIERWNTSAEISKSSIDPSSLGCRAYYLKPAKTAYRRDNEAKLHRCVLVGYEASQSRYEVWDPVLQKVVHSPAVVLSGEKRNEWSWKEDTDSAWSRLF